jgi:hypothetical protein
MRSKWPTPRRGALTWIKVVRRSMLHCLLRGRAYTRSMEGHMPFKQVLFRSAAREKILRGTTQLADAVRVTLGPRSKSVLIQSEPPMAM